MSTDPTPPDPARPTVGNSLAWWVGNILFSLSVIFAAGWLLVLFPFIMAGIAGTVPVLSTVFLVEERLSGLLWALADD
jgi:hypothetical protein